MPPGMLSVTTAQPAEQAATIRYPGYRLLRLPTFKQDATAVKRVNEVERPVWFLGLPGGGPMGNELEGRGPFTIQELRLKWCEGAITGQTLVWTSDKPYSEWLTVDDLAHRRLKELLLKTMLPLLPDAQRALELAANQDEEDEEDEEIEGHEGRPLRVYDHRLLCEDCGALGSVGCRACKDNRLEATNGMQEEVGSLEHATEVIPGFLWFGETLAARRKLVDDLGITHVINASLDLPNSVDVDLEPSPALLSQQAQTMRQNSSGWGPASTDRSRQASPASGRTVGMTRSLSTMGGGTFRTKLPDGRDMPPILPDMTATSATALQASGQLGATSRARGGRTATVADPKDAEARSTSPLLTLSPSHRSTDSKRPASKVQSIQKGITFVGEDFSDETPDTVAATVTTPVKGTTARQAAVQDIRNFRKQNSRSAKDSFVTQAQADKRAAEDQALKDEIRRNMRRVSFMQVPPPDPDMVEAEGLLQQFDVCFGAIERVRLSNLGTLLKESAAPPPDARVIAMPNRMLVFSSDGDAVSAMIVAAYLIRALGFSFDNAVSIIRRSNPDLILPSAGAMALTHYASRFATGRVFCPDCFASVHQQRPIDTRNLPSAALVAVRVLDSLATRLRMTRRLQKGMKVDARVFSDEGAPAHQPPGPIVDLRGEAFENAEHLSRFAHALAQWPKLNAGPVVLDLTGVGLGETGLQCLSLALLRAAQGGSDHGLAALSTLLLGHNRLSDRGVALLLHSLLLTLPDSHRPFLTHLDLSNNEHLGSQTAQALYDWLRDEACSLASLDLSRCGLGDVAASVIIDALSPPEYHQLLSLSSSSSSSPEAADQSRQVFELINHSSSPTTITLATMGGWNEGAFSATHAGPGFRVSMHPPPVMSRVKLANASLTSLDLRGNGLGDLSYGRLKHALRDNRVLTSVGLGGNRPPPEGPSLELLECLRYAAIYPNQLSRLDLSHCALPASLGEPLSRMLGQEHCSLQHLDLSFNSLDGDAVAALTEELQRYLTHAYVTGSPLLTLDLSCNPDVGTRGAVVLADVFMGRGGQPTLQLTDQLTQLTQPRQLKIRELQLSGCGIGAEGFKALAEVLGLAQCPLQMLGLSENQGATPDAMAAMGRALAGNQSLLHLDLAHTGLGPEGVRGLVKGLRRNHTLTRLSLARNGLHDGGAVSLSRWLSNDGAMHLRDLDLSHCHVGDDGMGALHDALTTDSESSRDRQCLELNLRLTGNKATLNTRTYAPDVPIRPPLEPYDALMPPHLARSKRTLAYAKYPILDPLHDMSAWGRGEGEAVDRAQESKGRDEGQGQGEGGQGEAMEVTMDWRHRAAVALNTQRAPTGRGKGEVQGQRTEGAGLALTSRLAVTRGERA